MLALTPMAATVGKAIRERRQELGLSQAAVAAAARVERAHLTRIEGGRWVPRLDTLARIAAALRVPLATLVRAK